MKLHVRVKDFLVWFLQAHLHLLTVYTESSIAKTKLSVRICPYLCSLLIQYNPINTRTRMQIIRCLLCLSVSIIIFMWPKDVNENQWGFSATSKVIILEPLSFVIVIIVTMRVLCNAYNDFKQMIIFRDIFYARIHLQFINFQF